MATEVKSLMKQLYDIEKEIEYLREKTKKINKKKKDIESNIQTLLNKTNLEAVKYENIIVYNKTKTVKTKLSKTEKTKSIKQALNELGIDNPEEVLKTIKEASYGEENIKDIIKIKKV
jgi:predicted component of type VI protein secretion system